MKNLRKTLAAVAIGRKTIRFGGSSVKRSLGREAASFLAVLLRIGVTLKRTRCEAIWGRAIRSGCACDLFVTGLQGMIIPDHYENLFPSLKAKRNKLERILRELNNGFHDRYVRLNKQTRGPYRVAIDHSKAMLENYGPEIYISDYYDSHHESIPVTNLTELDCDYIIRGYNRAKEYFGEDCDDISATG